MAMGAADAVPGVSGGTVAFITGIYERLLTAIRSIHPGKINVWRQQGFQAFWNSIDGYFLLSLLGGILSSLLLLAHLIGYLLSYHPLLLSGFFFGLIAASVVVIYRQISRHSVSVTLGLLAGMIMMTLVSQLVPDLSITDPFQVFIAGSIAICAMILPGISGSFLLLVMGMYSGIIEAVRTLDFVTLVWFASGCVVGLLSFSHFLGWLFRRFRNMTLAVLTGVLIGSLQQIWPWKQMISYKLNAHGEAVPIVQENLLPEGFELITGADAQLVPVIILMIAGFMLVMAFELKYKK
ncbi:DUF368 domain-containing protein [Oceanospirillum sp. D5]|uniref:DUF368 domain-containing protein n=2 Tax=Oceanospirillum sediminis TaxID=2760088 RepID=A0A839IJB7_9GAMM|nr:DUF368 domain-containing protein [Oceanospirillum sediminis]MBB1485018.1 DUF368 domain-containing protein [Oceanospirillum sediminis]